MKKPITRAAKVPPRLSLKEAAELLKVETDQVLKWTERGRLRAIKPEGDEPAYLREEILRLLEELDAERPGPPKTFPVVGIGASAGGLEAVTELLKALKPDLGMAYVFISHLSPDHESLLPELLQKKTSMPVNKVENGMMVEANNVYVIPPNASMSIVDGVLTLQEPRARTDKGFHPINAFLMALAEVYQMNAIGVVLSGTATDGTMGLKAIRAGGGWTFTQDDTAKYKDMPHSAQEAGVVDFVLPPAAIAQQLADLRAHPVAELAGVPKPMPDDERAVHQILVRLHKKRGVDFTQYKRSTINRRILRRMLLSARRNLAQYAQLVSTSNEEADALFDDLLINVTSFFREPKFYHALASEILPQMLRDRTPDEPLRIWVAGCSTGEESVSIAITLMERFADKILTIPVQIFSTDLDAKMVEKARLGMYGKIALESLSALRLKQYFIKIDGQYQVIKAIRDMCVFAQHDLLKDPPFSRIDLLSCQNVLIYLDTNAQQRILRGFHYALKPSGVLALGRSETVNPAGDIFKQADKDAKFYTKRNHKTVFTDFSTRTSPPPLPPDHNGKEEKEPVVANSEVELDREAERMLLHRHMPASVVVNRDLEIVRFRGSTGPYMEPHAGRASLSLLKMLRQDLVFELRALLRKVKQERAPLLRSGLEITVDGIPRMVSIEVAPMRVSLDEDHYLIVFLDETAPPPAGVQRLKPPTKQQVQDARDRKNALMERELRDLREQMRIMAEEAEATAEELHTAHEEVLSSNEELQSMNEELQTSKEELQSTNEELSTTNDELQQRHDQLKEARDYADAIISTLDSPLVILNGNMRVRMANAAFYRTFRTTKEETEGILIHELGNHQWDVDTLRKHLFDVLTHGTEMRDFEVTHTYPDIGDRTIVLNANRIDHLGVQQRILITMQDITERRKHEDALMRLAAIVTSSEDAILSMDLDGKVLTWNDGATRLYGYTAEEMLGQPMHKLIPGNDAVEEERLLEKVRKGGSVSHYETVRIRKDGTPVQVSLTISPMRSADGRITGISKSARDISQMKETEVSLRESEQRFHLLAENMDQLAWIDQGDGSSMWFNKRWEEYTGIPCAEMSERMAEIQHPEHAQAVAASLKDAQKRGVAWEHIMPLRGRDGGYRWFLSRTVPLSDGNGEVEHWFGTATDITDRMKAEEAMREADKRKDEFLATLAHELRNPLAPLRSGLEVLTTVEGDEALEHTRAIMERQVNHMVRLVDDLLDLGRISSGRLVLSKEPMDLQKAMDVAIESTRPMLKAKNQYLDTQRPKQALMILGDTVRITQVISNLLHNASKYTGHGGSIGMKMHRSNGSVELTVTDNGIGIPAEMLNHVFDMFAQVNPDERSKAGGGLGIGLHIVKRIIAMHGGEIFVKSEGKGKGSTFTVILPLTQDEGAKAMIEEEEVTLPGRQRVLVVDDNEDSSLMLSMVLRAMDSETRIANSGADALRIGESFRPTVVFMDIGMPEMDGYEACRRMRRTTWGAEAHIYALTGWGQESDKRLAHEAGFDAHLVKPVDRSTVMKVLAGR